MENIKALLDNDQFARHCGIVLEEVSSGYARATVKLDNIHLNGMGVIQGGLLFTLADYAFAAACNSHGHLNVAISANIHFVAAARQGVLTAIAEKVSEPARVSTYQVTVRDESGQTVASFQGLAYRKNQPLPPLED